jgi:hypothetical protein
LSANRRHRPIDDVNQHCRPLDAKKKLDRKQSVTRRRRSLSAAGHSTHKATRRTTSAGDAAGRRRTLDTAGHSTSQDNRRHRKLNAESNSHSTHKRNWIRYSQSLNAEGHSTQQATRRKKQLDGQRRPVTQQATRRRWQIDKSGLSQKPATRRNLPLDTTRPLNNN